jgi:hypothetical protein
MAATSPASRSISPPCASRSLPAQMPVLGYLGFTPFALECYAMYHWLRGWLGEEGRGRAVL